MFDSGYIRWSKSRKHLFSYRDFRTNQDGGLAIGLIIIFIYQQIYIYILINHLTAFYLYFFLFQREIKAFGLVVIIRLVQRGELNQLNVKLIFLTQKDGEKKKGEEK